MYRKVVSWAAAMLWMIVLFHLSAQIAEQSSELSTGITKMIIDAIEWVAPNVDMDVNDFHFILRKSAHFFAYMVLGILVLNALRESNVMGYRSIFIAAVICVLYAASDEIHQLYVPGRSGQLRDVLIDSAGSSVGMIVYWVFKK